jgi:hypothetical protein
VLAGKVATCRGGQLYIVIDSNLDPKFAMTKPNTCLSWLARFNTLVKSDFYDTILGAYLFAGEKGLGSTSPTFLTASIREASG